jgi:hypothetical protein
MSKLLDEIHKDYNIIMMTEFGSHLYGTNTPESDRDYKGIYMPTKEQILLGKFPKVIKFDSNNSDTKNTSEDVDCEIYSFHYFMELLAKGETVAIDMLHADGEQLITYNHEWSEIYDNRKKFYTKNMKAFLGYCQKQAAKYGMKGSRLNSAEVLMEYLYRFDGDTRMFKIWKEMPEDENMKHVANDGGSLRVQTFNFCGKQIQATTKVSYITEMVQKFYDAYGDRAIQAKNNEGVDWKAMSHAIRSAVQLEEIYSTWDLKFPLQHAELLKDIKLGVHPFDKVLSYLESHVETVHSLAEDSFFPDCVDKEWVKKFTLKIITKSLF